MATPLTQVSGDHVEMVALGCFSNRKGTSVVTCDQALFSFRFVNNIPASMAKPLERMYENRSNWA